MLSARASVPGKARFIMGWLPSQTCATPSSMPRPTISPFSPPRGDNGTANIYKEPVEKPAVIPYPSVGWPASDPLVTGVGATYLCTNASTGTSVDSVSPPVQCQSNPGVRAVGWIDSGGGYSILFPS